MPSIPVWKLFNEERDAGISIFTGGREQLDYEELKDQEIDAVLDVVKTTGKLLKRISPKLADDWFAQENLFVKMAGVAKATFPESKPITYPSEPGTIGVAPLFPQAIKYTASPSPAEPAYSDYENNSWEINLTAGTPAYLFGSDNTYYKASPIQNQHAFLVIAQNGVIEVGTTPSIQQFKIETETMSKYGVYVAHPLVDVSVEKETSIYQYPTLGAIPIYHNLGIKWKVLPSRTTRASIRLLGLVFYEHDFAPDVKWI